MAFSTVVDVLALVVHGIHKSVHAVYAAKAVEVGTSVNALYDKLNGVEPAVCKGAGPDHRPAADGGAAAVARQAD